MKIVIYNHKGGVGKTTLAAHIGFQAMHRKLPLTVIDADQQHNCMSWLSGHSWDGSTEYQQGSVTVTNDVGFLDKGKNLTIIDAPPGFEFVENFPGADVWIVPCGGRFSVTGALAVIERVKKHSRVVVVANMVDTGTRFGRQEMEEIKKVGAELFAVPIPRHDVVRRAEGLGRASWDVPYGIRANAAQNLQVFADWVLQGCQTRGVMRE